MNYQREAAAAAQQRSSPLHDGGGDSIAVARSFSTHRYRRYYRAVLLPDGQSLCGLLFSLPEGRRRPPSYRAVAALVSREAWIWVSPMHELMYPYVIEHVEFDYRSNGS